MPTLESMKVKDIKKKVKELVDKVRIPKYYKMKKSDLINAIKNHEELDVIENDKEVDIRLKKNKVLKKNGRFITIKRKKKPVKKQREETPGSIEAKRIKKKIADAKAKAGKKSLIKYVSDEIA